MVELAAFIIVAPVVIAIGFMGLMICLWVLCLPFALLSNAFGPTTNESQASLDLTENMNKKAVRQGKVFLALFVGYIILWACFATH